MKKQLRLLAWILSLTMLCELLPFSAFAQSDVGEALASTVSTLLDETNDIVDSGTCGDNVTWSFSSDGTLTISGTGDMFFTEDHAPWYANRDKITHVEITQGVTSIEESAFLSCSKLINVSIPDSVTSIGPAAFSSCNSLPSISIPDGVTSIEADVFKNCWHLTSISIPNSVTSIKEQAFYRCNRLPSISIPDSVTSIGSSAFSGCDSLSSISIPDGVTSIEEWTFNNCFDLTSVSIPNSVTSIGSEAFSGCLSLPSISIPDSVTSIGSYAFNGCNSLTSISIPDGVTFIGSSAFQGCISLPSISIPASVTSIEASTFYGCSNLTSISIPASVTYIGRSAFYDCAFFLDVYYSGTEEQWNKIYIYNYKYSNPSLFNATIHYNSNESEATDKTHHVTVINGTIDFSLTSEADIPEGEDVGIVADNLTTSEHKRFTGWNVTSGNIVLDDNENYRTTFTMKNTDVTIVATYSSSSDFMFGWDNFSFDHNADDFFSKQSKSSNQTQSAVDFLVDTPTYLYHEISKDKFDKLTSGLSKSKRKFVQKKAYEEWHGSCYGLTLVAMMHYASPERIQLNKLDFGDTPENIYNLTKPCDSQANKDLIEYYYLSQYLPSVYNRKILRIAKCTLTPNIQVNKIVNSLKNNIPVFADLKTHAIVLLSIINEDSQGYTIRVYDPNSWSDGTLQTPSELYLYKTNSLYSIGIKYGTYKTINSYYLATEINKLDPVNYFGSTSTLSSTDEISNFSYISSPSNSSYTVTFGDSTFSVTNGELSSYSDDLSDSLITSYSINDASDESDFKTSEVYFPTPESSSTFKISFSSKNPNNAYILLNNTFLSLSTNGPSELKYNESTQTMDLTSDAPTDANILLTNDNTTENWPWHSWAIDTTGTTTLHAELTDEGLKLSGDGLNNAAFATENADTEDTQTSTISAKADSDTGIASVTIKNNQDSEGNNTLEVTQPSNTTKPTAHTISVTNGSASVTSATSGEIVTITAADKSAEKKVFTSWTVNSGNITLDDSSASTTSFVMGSENISITANYKTVSTTPSEPSKPTEPDKPETPSSDDDVGGALILLGVGAAAVAAATAGVVYMMPVKIQGKVESIDHVAIPNAKISILKNGNVVAQTTADENGNFEFKVKRGTYELTAAYTDTSGQLVHQTVQQKAPAENVVITF